MYNYRLLTVMFLFIYTTPKVIYRTSFCYEDLMREKKVFYVCSYGGCGSRMLTNFLGQYGTAVHIHSRVPSSNITFVDTEAFNSQLLPLFYLSKVKVIYLFKDPTSSQLSRWNNNHFKHVGVSTFIADVEDYVRNNVDLLNYEEFFDNYVNNEINKNYQIIAINYNKMWDNLPQIFEVLGMPQSAIKAFPKRVEGKSSRVRKDQLDPWVLEGLNKINKPLIDKIDAMPAVTVLGPYK